MQQQGTNGRIVLPQPSQDPQRAPYSRSHPVRSPVQGSHNAPLAQGQQPVMSVYQQPQLPRLIPPQSLSNTSDLRQHASIPPVAPTPTAQTIPNTTPIHSHPQSPNLLPPKPRPSPVITSQHTPGTNVTTVTPTPFIRPHTPPPVAQAVKDIPTTPNRPGSPIQPRPDEISPISTPSASPPPDAAEAQNTADETQSQQGRKRPFEATTAVIETRKEASLDGVMETSGDERAAHQQQQGALAIEDEDSSLRPPQPKRRKSMVSIPPTSTPSTPTPTGLATARTMPVSASDRTAAARAASAAKRARGGRNAGRGRGGRARAAEVDIKTETEEEGSQSIEEEDGAEEKATPRPKRGGRRGGKRGAATAAAAAARRAAAEKAEEEESGEATANEDEPTVKQVEEEDEMEDITTTTDIEATPTPKSVALRNQRHKPVGPSKRKRLTSPPPDVGEGQEEPATPVPTASPTLTSATSIRKPPANIQLPPPAMPKFESQSTTTSTLSSASFLPPTPSPGINGPHTAASTTSSSTATTSRNMVGHQAQVIATKKFQQLSAPLLHNISAHRFANLFMNPVGERVAPGYSKLVHKPMDLKSKFFILIPTLPRP